MSLYGELVLASDVEIFAIADLPQETRDAVPHGPDDFAVSRTRSRATSRVLDREARDLLLEFVRPTRIVDAVIRFASGRGADPQATLEGAFELLDRLYRMEVLVSTAKRRRNTAERRPSPGTKLFGLMLRTRVHQLEDTEVFFAHDEAGQALAVKFVRGGVERVEREARAMRLAASCAPWVQGVYEWRGHGVLASEWVFGEDLIGAAGALRGSRGDWSEAALLELCRDVACAFGEIHRVGVLHGDIHPRNVLVDARGRVRVIDFGLAVEIADEVLSSARAGVAFYMEPELAAANLGGRGVAPSALGEEYSVGALLYLMWTGTHYLDWSLERAPMLKQIVEDPVVPFARRRVSAWPELEAVLHRALAKRRDARFRSCDHLARALRRLAPGARRRHEAAVRAGTPTRDPCKELSEAFLERCGIGGPVLRGRPLNPPFASLNYGAAGIAYAMYRIALARDDAHLLATADVWAQKAVVLASQPEAFHTSEIEITKKTVGNASLFHSPTGVHAVRALIALSSGEPELAARATADFIAASRAPCEFIDATLGKASLLVGCAALLEASWGAAESDTGPLIARGDELREQVKRAVDGSTFATSTSTNNLGFAHGWAGLLFSLLRWSQARCESAEPYRAKLDELASLHEPHGAGVRWPVHNRTIARVSYMEGWCNGSAGHALLWALAHERLGRAEYGLYAERAARSAWSSALELGTICCGLAGIGYACAAAHRVTGDTSWLAKARIAARRASEDRSEWFYRDSLYKGAVGVVLLREELEASLVATPLFET